MRVEGISSGSKGNAYIISDGSTDLMIECGVPMSKLMKNCDIDSISAVLISHRHGDHCKAIAKMHDAGVEIYAPADVFDAYKLSGSGCNIAEPFMPFKVGTFSILPFDLHHDVINLGYLICSLATGERLLYFTDTYMVKYKFEGLTHIMAECNYSMRMLRENTELGLVPLFLKDRIKVSHMSIEQLLEFFKANDLSKAEQIYLIHISDNNGNPVTFKRRVKKLTGVPVEVFT